MAQRSNKKSAVQTRRFVFSALNRQRAVVFTQNGKSVTIQKGVRFGNLNPPLQKELPTEQLAAKEVDDEAANLTAKGFKELNESEYKLFIERLRISCADDDLRGFPESSEEENALSERTEGCGLESDGQSNGGGQDCADTEDSVAVSLGQRAVQVLLANTELKSCKTLEFILPPSDIIQALKSIADKKSGLNIETLVLKAARPSDKNSPEEQDSENAYNCDSDYAAEENWTDLPCDCLSAAFPKIKRLILIGGTWELEGEDFKSLEELEAEEMPTPSIRLDKLKRLKYGRSLFYSNIESDSDFKPLSPASLLAERCPKLQALDFDADGNVEILEDILTSPLIDRLISLKIGTFDSSALDKIYLLFTRFTDRLSKLEDVTVILEGDSLKKSKVERLKAFPIPLNIEFE